MRPRPEVAMPVSAVVSLHSKPQRLSFETPAIQPDHAGKNRVGMRRSRESNPALVAQRDPKFGMILQIPRDRMPSNFQFSAAGALADFILAHSEMKWILSSGAEIQPLQPKPLNKAFRFSIPGEPRSPHLHGHPVLVSRATAPSRIHQQISEPPCPAAIGQSQTKKPYFVTAPD